jgi:hypothetical protein
MFQTTNQLYYIKLYTIFRLFWALLAMLSQEICVGRSQWLHFTSENRLEKTGDFSLFRSVLASNAAFAQAVHLQGNTEL